MVTQRAKLCHTRLPPHPVIAGIDVGEDFLDLALIDPSDRQLHFAIVDLRRITGTVGDSASAALEELARRVSQAAPNLKQGAIAVIDSPRWPRDLDWSQASLAFRTGEVTGRALDAGLQSLVKNLRRAGDFSVTLSMFPTPKLAYFLSQIRRASCKPHLRAFGSELFGDQADHPVADGGGGTFTRFMLSGFAAYCALGAMRVTCYEGFPDLQFRLWNGSRPLPSKMKNANKRSALDARLKIIAELAHRIGITCPSARTLDQADAGVLALSVAAEQAGHQGVDVEHPAEGRFRLTLPSNLIRIDW